jgi:uncharacterized protein
MAAINLSTTAYIQNFDSLGTGIVNWTNDSTFLPGWYAAAGNTPPTSFAASNGSTTTGAFYNFGATSASDRALGAIPSGGTNYFYGVRLINNTGSTITGLNIGYTGEQWRNSGTNAAQKLDFQYQIGATSITAGTWTDFNTLDFSSPIFSNTAAVLNGNVAANQTAKSGSLSGLTLTNGNEIWLRWQDLNDPNTDHGLAIDNFSVSVVAVPEPSDMMGTVLAVCAVMMLKRRLSPAKKNKL